MSWFNAITGLNGRAWLATNTTRTRSLRRWVHRRAYNQHWCFHRKEAKCIIGKIPCPPVSRCCCFCSPSYDSNSWWAGVCSILALRLMLCPSIWVKKLIRPEQQRYQMCWMLTLGIRELLVQLMCVWTQNFRFFWMSKCYFCCLINIVHDRAG